MGSKRDIHLLLDYCKAVSYACVYLTKSHGELSEVMKQAVWEALESGKTVREGIKPLAKVCGANRKMSCCHRVPRNMVEKISAILATSKLPERRFKACHGGKETKFQSIVRASLKRKIYPTDIWIDQANTLVNEYEVGWCVLCRIFI